MTTRPGSVPVVAAVVTRSQGYLVCRRAAHKRHGGLWEFPGGKVMEGETHADAIRRELLEELELEAVAVGTVLFTAADEGAPFVIDFVQTDARGTPVLHEHSDFGWFTAEELLGLALAPADARFVTSLGGRQA
ncbi:MAG: NUDIX domain-containing protein [Gemmatimonadota bacterium]|nr:NUDIX domain-containing protein [Gemmatimonadota bacterium]MDH3423895.1 NUDIX domain-containing protein [Gemmatimonadota bacterium]